jgi:hypothetical protein
VQEQLLALLVPQICLNERSGVQLCQKTIFFDLVTLPCHTYLYAGHTHFLAAADAIPLFQDTHYLQIRCSYCLKSMPKR